MDAAETSDGELRNVTWGKEGKDDDSETDGRQRSGSWSGDEFHDEDSMASTDSFSADESDDEYVGCCDTLSPCCEVRVS